MKNSADSPRPLDDRLVDRLVDGELDAAERRSLVAMLDESPHGWRQCALAFFEAQAWRHDLQGVVVPCAVVQRRADDGAPAGRRSRRRLRRASGMATVVVVAFVAGWLAHPDRERIDRNAGDAVVSVGSVPKDDPSAVAESGSESEPAGPPTPPAVRLAGVFQFEVQDHGRSRTVAIPVLEGPAVDPGWLLAQPPAIQASTVKDLERRGHRVEAHRELLTVNLKDGRKLILPVEEVDVRFANRVFQ